MRHVMRNAERTAHNGLGKVHQTECKMHHADCEMHHAECEMHHAERTACHAEQEVHHHVDAQRIMPSTQTIIRSVHSMQFISHPSLAVSQTAAAARERRL